MEPYDSLAFYAYLFIYFSAIKLLFWEKTPTKMQAPIQTLKIILFRKDGILIRVRKFYL